MSNWPIRHVVSGCLLLSLAIPGPRLAYSQVNSTRRVKSKVEAVYPELARPLRLSGVVRVQVVITPAGTIKSTKVVGGNPVLAEAALQALRQWKFEPDANETTELMDFRFSPQ